MADWTDNPFAAPAEEASPMEDPSVTEASSTMPEYDPFANVAAEPDAKPKTKPAVAQVATVTATTITHQEEPDWAKSGSSKAEPAKKEKPKPKKQTKEEKKRQAAYEANQAAAADPQAAKDPNYRPANWPPFPEQCYWPFKPCYHHDFKGEIPEWGYGSVRQTYYHWLAYFFVLFANFVGTIVASSANHDDSSQWTNGIFLALAYWVGFSILAYSCWFQSLYQAMRKDSSLRFGWFFFTFAFQWITSLVMLIGVPSMGACGIISTIQISNEDGNAIEALVMGIVVILWALLLLWASLIIKSVLQVYRSSGQSLQKAQKEAITGAVANSV